MGLLAVASAKGAPGVTTAAMAVAAMWPRPSVLVECDPAGGDVAWRMPAPNGAPLDPQGGLLSLVAAGRKSFHPGLVMAHSQPIVGGLGVVTGVVAPEQAAGVRQWDQLAALFAEVPGIDVVADLGRIGAGTPQNALLRTAAAVLMLVDTVPSNVVHLRERLSRLHRAAGPMAPPVYVAVVSPPKRGRAVREVREALGSSTAPVAGVHHLAHDPAGARFFLGQVRGNPQRTNLVRSLRPVVDALADRTAPAFVERGGEPAADQAPSAGEPVPGTGGGGR
jgi:hypothetical protein